MTVGAGATAFVTGATGFIGMELVRVLIARGCQVSGLAESIEAAQRLRRAGAVPVVGDLLEPGQWQDEADADWVFHIPPHPVWGARLSWHRTVAAHERVARDSSLLDAVAGGETRRVVYVADASRYGETGPRPITEDTPLQPFSRADGLAAALDHLDGYVFAGLPIVTAFPGWVYGNGSWFRDRVIEPVMAARRVLQFGTPGPWISPIHVHDCARALVHLAEHGEIGGRYFVVNSEPVRLNALAGTFARLANRPLRVWRMPAAAARLVVGPVLARHLTADAVYSNIRLRGIRFGFDYPTPDEGLQQVVGALDD
jgi:nucleoside-diphosphate-sugar epimerase